MLVKNLLKRILSPDQRLFLKSIQVHILSIIFANDFKKLATLHGTDKWNSHWYAQHYEKHFAPLRKKKLNLLEIGVGGYKAPDEGGGSLRAWKYYLPHSMIYALDIYDKSLLQEKRIKIFQGSQADESFLNDVIKQIGEVDIIIDDGSHLNEHVITTFKVLFPLLKQDGIYVVEDTQTSYFPNYGGDAENFNNPRTMMSFFKSLTDGINHAEFPDHYKPNYFDQNIISIQFYHNLIFIFKGRNTEKSNALKVT